MEKVFLGTLKHTAKLRKTSFLPYNEGSTRNRIYLEKHSWDCGWYWGFGYIGNAALHTHFDSTFLGLVENNVNKLFINPRFTQNEWNDLIYLFSQAYRLQKTAEVYQLEGYSKFSIFNPEKAQILNNDLENILNEIWRICNK